MKKLVTTSILLIFCLLLGCPEVSPPENQNGDDLSSNEVFVDSPFNVKVEKDTNSNAIVLTWDDSNSSNYYEVERIVIGKQSELLTKKPIFVRHFRDTTYPPDVMITYRVRATRNGAYSKFTEPTMSVNIPLNQISVQHTHATKLENKNSIQISWDPLENNEVSPIYRIRRYDSRESGEITPDVYSVEFVPTFEDLSITINGKLCFVDDTVLDHVAYYYSVLWINQFNNEQGKHSRVVIGMSSEYDYCDIEPNDLIDNIDISQSFLPLPDQKLIIFDYLEPEDKDIDWYNYAGDPCNLQVTVSLANGFNLAGNLEFLFLHNGKTYSCGTINNSFPFKNVFLFPREYFAESSAVEEPVIVSGNKIVNGHFSAGTWNWNFGVYEGANATVNGNNNEMNVIINYGGTEEWHVQLIQPGITIENGKTYLVNLDARSQSNTRIMPVNIGQSVEPYTTYSECAFLELSTEMTKYSFIFTMIQPTDSNSRMEFNLGSRNESVFIDNIELYEIEYQSVEIDPAVQFCIRPAQNTQNIFGIYQLSVEEN